MKEGRKKEGGREEGDLSSSLQSIPSPAWNVYLTFPVASVQSKDCKFDRCLWIDTLGTDTIYSGPEKVSSPGVQLRFG